MSETARMQLHDAVLTRRMTRTFEPGRTIPREQLEMMLKLAIRAPSAGHTQGRRFLVLDDITTVARFWSATTDGTSTPWLSGMQTAPVLIVCFGDRAAYVERYAEQDKGWVDRSVARWPVPYWHVDTGMSAMILLLAARDAELGACLFGVPADRWTSLAATFDVDHDLVPVCVIALGHPAPGDRSRPMRRQTRSFEQLVTFAADST